MFIELQNLAKHYGGVKALDGVSFGIEAGEVHALCGENGAGKSTLIKCLTGVVAPTAGRVLVDGQPLPPGDIRAAEEAGIAVVHQESTSFPHLDAVDNLFVGRELRKGPFLDRAAMEARTKEVLDRLGQPLDLRVPVGQFTVAQRQMVEMARALLRECRLLILDEPTASLSARETKTLLARVKQLQQEGVAVLYVSHRLNEIFELSDRTTVLRDGGFVTTAVTAELDEPALVAHMVGREVDTLSRHHAHEGRTEKPCLEVSGLTCAGAYRDISFAVHAGEIVGLAGLVGAGRSEVVNTLFGVDAADSGSVSLEGEPLPSGDLATALARGIALVPEDRQHQGLVLPMTVGENLSMAVLQDFVRKGVIDRAAEGQRVQELIEELTVKTAGPDVPVETLSGGNQQKVVLGKWLANRPKLLMLDEPTRGVDVGAKAEIHRLIRQLTTEGMATLVVSSDLPEVLALCDRIIVMCEGRIAGELDGATATQEDVLRLALPGGSDEGGGMNLFALLTRHREAGLAALIALLALLATFFDGSFVLTNGIDILINSVPVLIIACGVMLVIVTGEIDISVGSLLGLCAAVLGLLASTNEPGLGWSAAAAIPVVLLLGTVVGLGTGALVVFGRVPSIIATLGLLIALDGVQDWLIGGGDIKSFPDGLRILGTGTVIPINLVIAMLVLIATQVLITRTPLGRRIFALGSNPGSARLAGLSPVKLKLFVFAFTGFLTALAAVLWVAKLGNVSTSTGAALELKVVTCVVVGGVAISGGKGRLLGVILAVVLITMIRTVLNFMDLGAEAVKWQRAIEGAMILVAVISDHLGKSSGSGGHG